MRLLFQKYRISFIHYRQPDNEQSDDWAVVEEDLLVFQRDASSCKFELIKDPCNYFDLLERGKWWQIDHPKYPKHEYDRDEAVHRARQRRGEREYNIVSNNCEHFVTEILTGSKRCDQVGVRGLVRSSTASSATSFRLLPKWLRNSAPSSVASSAAATATATSAASNAAVKSSTPSYRNRVLMAFFVAFLLSLLVSNYAMSCVLLAAIMIFIKFF